MLGVIWGCLLVFSGEVFSEKVVGEGFCVFGSLDLFDNESSLRIITW